MHGQLSAAESCFRLGLKYSDPLFDSNSLKLPNSNAALTPRLSKLLGDCLFAQDKFKEASSLYQKVFFTIF
jgi:hypothetical protein